MINDQGTHRRPPTFPLFIFFFLPSVVSEPPLPPPPPCLPSLFFFTNTTAVALSVFPIAANHPTTLSLCTTAMASHLLFPWLLFLPDPPSASLLSLSSTGDLPCSLFFLYCRSLPTSATVVGPVVLLAESLRSPSPPCFPPMPPISYVSALYTKGSTTMATSMNATMIATPVKKEVMKRMMKRIHQTLRSMVLPVCFSSLILEKFKKLSCEISNISAVIAVYQEFIAGQGRKEPLGEATLGNINAGLQKDHVAPNYEVITVIFIVVALLCRSDAFPPPSSSSPSLLALAP